VQRYEELILVIHIHVEVDVFLLDVFLVAILDSVAYQMQRFAIVDQDDIGQEVD
jgi:hypothetical protein